MTLFRLDASIRTEGSVTRELADSAQAAWQEARPGQSVIRRDLAADPLPADAWSTSALSGFVPAEQHTEEQLAAKALASTLAEELLAADAYLFAVPLYNWGVSQHFKTWFDLLVTDPRFAPGGDTLLEGKPAALYVARGGGYGPGTPKEGWDHATPWMVRILQDVLKLDLKVSVAELTLAPVTPGMEGLLGLAQDSLDTAQQSAREHGKSLADQVAAAV
ncbi:FMN-dependent NADH-azoreductase [Actinoalloteichus hymeniacidonis]|uniref:FMN dependent NADH:quinone oxidoreductase n=1 Tax=Actinoalloteichus hymeniacidonis TaxID=340345 RepID=A0AAC9HKV5_9PSEU|nr:NAD(P)H-dependent oxidoreductase [Actinoalloteichus hymeniacidonis]AOS61016.1 acyl carrier protein phosphodiesterase [Actinoalloteichus hymeniacidonis]MBB5910984.1 FMN-dependent NADH-azoreductase [Actinoalloteichus hymeniacidonis]